MTTNNILITGVNGQLGRELKATLTSNSEVNVYGTDVSELDITDSEAIDTYVKDNSIDYIVNCAAYTAVDAAEDNIELCRKLNVVAPAYLAQTAKKYNAKLIHISTDYVFDGYNYQPYTETDKTNPKSVYGATKLEGEDSITRIAPESIIIRTSWLYSPHGKNFVKTMLKLGYEKDNISVVCDQIGTPTSATDLANAIATILLSNKWESGRYHFSNEGAISWYDFTKSILRISGITKCKVTPIASRLYPTKALRPFYSVLDKSKIKEHYNISIPHWEESLEKCIKILNS